MSGHRITASECIQRHLDFVVTVLVDSATDMAAARDSLEHIIADHQEDMSVEELNEIEAVQEGLTLAFRWGLREAGRQAMLREQIEPEEDKRVKPEDVALMERTVRESLERRPPRRRKP